MKEGYNPPITLLIWVYLGYDYAAISESADTNITLTNTKEKSTYIKNRWVY